MTSSPHADDHRQISSGHVWTKLFSIELTIHLFPLQTEHLDEIVPFLRKFQLNRNEISSQESLKIQS